MVACDSDDWACQHHWDEPIIPDNDEYTFETGLSGEDVDKIHKVEEIVAPIIFDPIDWLMMYEACTEGDCSPWYLLALVGPVSGSGAKYFGKIIPTNYIDEAADLLAKRIGGIPRVRFESVNREFDAISAEFIAQAKPAMTQISKQFREQAKATFQAALDTGRKVYYQFEGKPSQAVIDKLREHSKVVRWRGVKWSDERPGDPTGC